MCKVQIKLAGQREVAYRSAVARMKEIRGSGFERAWQLAENRRVAFQMAGHLLQQHEREHLCGTPKSFAMAG